MTEVVPQVPRPRIQGLSDLIFGLALSLGAIQFIGNLPSHPGDLNLDLAEFGFSFLILISVWNRYTTTMSVMPVETSSIVRLNTLLLFLVAIEPFLLDVLFIRGFGADVGVQASLYYGLDIGGMNLILAFFTHLLTSEEKNLIPPNLIKRYRLTRNLLILASALFLVSALPIFWTIDAGGLPLRIILWIVTLPVVWIQRVIGNRFG